MSLDDYELEERLRTHLHQQAEAIHIEPAFEPHRRAQRQWARGGLSLVAAAAVVVVAGVGFAALTGVFERSGTTEVATVPDTDAETADVSDQDSAPVGNEEQGVDDVSTVATSFDVVDITNESTPSAFSGYRVDDGVYIVLSTAPGRISMTPPDDIDELDAYNELFIPRTFYTLDTSSPEGDDSGYTWQHNTVDERYVSGFEVHDGLLYAVSTGLTTGELAPAVGTSPDRGASWDWNDAPELSQASALAIDRSGAQLLIAGFRPSPVAPVDALALAAQGGLEINPADFVLGTYDFVEYFPPSAPGTDATLNDIVRVRWTDLGVNPPDSWRPWSGLYRYNADATVTELPIADTDETSRFLALNRIPSGPDYDISFERWPAAGEPESVASELTESLTWNSITSPFLAASGSAGPYRFAVDRPNTLPRLQRSLDGGPWETVIAEDLVPGEGVVTGQGLSLHDSRYGLFADFNAYSGPSRVVASPDGDNWQVIDAEFESFSVFDGEGEVLLIGNLWRENFEDGSTRQETYAYRLTPGQS